MRMVLAVMYREYRIRTTSLTWLFFDLFMPLTYLLLFGIGLDRTFQGGVALAGTTVSYNAFFLAGVLSMACFGIAINTSYGFFVDRDNGMLYEFLTYPMTRTEFLVGKILFNCLTSLLQATLTITLGALLLNIPVRLEWSVVLAPVIVLGTAGWFFFLTTFALLIRRNDMFNTFINVAYFLFMFASSLFYPAEALPAWLRVIALGNPFTWHTDIVRYLTIGVGPPGSVLAELGGFLLFTGASFGAASWTLRRGLLR